MKPQGYAEQMHEALPEGIAVTHVVPLMPERTDLKAGLPEVPARGQQNGGGQGWQHQGSSGRGRKAEVTGDDTRR